MTPGMYFTSFPLAEALAVTAVFGVAAWALGTVSPGGFCGGVILGAAIYYCTGWGGFLVLGAFFILGSGLTRLGFHRKAAKGLAQSERGRRGARHALANCAVGLALAAIYKSSGGNPLAGAAFVASFATAAADTAGTEVGSLSGRHPFLPTSFRKVAAGTPGAVSVEGTAAGAAAGALIALVGLGTGLAVSGSVALAAAAAAVLASWLESVLGAVAAFEKILGNPGKNIFNTAAGAGICLLLVKVLGLL